ncbi:MAG: glyoxylate/hydroxypyruvate reductase A [Rhodospirillales bacterium]|jgi:glyoxylate/hydroxypyruvate reductase A|nr:glyoxylate/hydroxypyruvate reductase A [Rhodospirillales bacterium]MDP6882713.1 glyoxylate/hydroxypyruvate reductase A [Rhodospirillales bacterium]
MALLFGGYFKDIHDPDQWRALFHRHLPDLEVREWPDGVGDPRDIEFTLIHNPAMGELKRYPNLKAIFTFGAGIEKIMKDPELPRGVPVVRLVSQELIDRMTEFVLYWVLHYHRDFHRYFAQERQAHWEKFRGPTTAERRVGILGVGELGADAAEKLMALGFDVAGWSRRAKSIKGMKHFHGSEGLIPFLARTDILVCLLATTPATEGIINARMLAALPQGAFVVNPARGAHLVDDDLIAAIDAEHIAGAALDVFHQEPLPATHAFWRHPRITVTPHAGSWHSAEHAAEHVAGNIRRILDGKQPHPVVDPAAGY